MNYTDEDVKIMRRFRRALLRSIGSDEGKIVMDHLKKRFETNLPSFQGTIGNYDPMDAMRRDAYKEIMMYIEHQMDRANNENTNISEEEDF